ncbi:MAG: cupin domain-containing protein [Pseudomonadota bacterium]
MPITTSNFFTLPAGKLDNECFDTLVSHPNIRIERIISYGHITPLGEWYDQPQYEWVLVVSGEATLRFEDDPTLHFLAKGDFIEIAPHRKHRVEATHPTEPTVWLAIHYS